MIPSIRNLPYEARLKKMGLWSLKDRRVRADLAKVYKIVHGLSLVKCDTFFEFSSCNWTLHYITLHYITVFSARPTTTRVGLAVQMSTMMLKTRSVKIKSR